MPTPTMPDQRERGDVAHLRAADQQHPHDDGDEHERGAEVGLQHDQRHRHAATASTATSRAASSSLLKWAIDRGQRDDHDDLGELATAGAGTGPTWNQAWLPLRSLPEAGDHHQQRAARAAVEDGDGLAVAAVVDHRDDEHQRRRRRR